MLKLNNIVKNFGALEAVKNISFTAEQGVIFGLLGPNGAGKTTTLRIILDILVPDSGTVTWQNEMIDEKMLNYIGYLPEERGLYQDQNVFDVLMYTAAIKNVGRTKAKVDIVRHLDRFDMVEMADRKIGTLSRGNQQKVQLLAATIHNPHLVILDEPFSGLDPINQTIVREYIIGLKKSGKAVLLSSHQMELVESLCDQIFLMNRGEMILQGDLQTIRKQESQGAIEIEAKDDITFLSAKDYITDLEYTKYGAIVHLDTGKNFDKLVQELVAKTRLRKLERKTPTLKDIFLNAIKKHNVS
jgi:ABC-2 type transport system ATP-binding protein